ncbi:MAG: hypothetical protein CVV64_09745 [Candidatus Wallbacteria bacterium HGW-Wallbacteria-1]|jgi:hypothetical protein|uniref:Uncharacterized protein n=1 Tax=Candidatus Wallbacteria bacterium HGW-Wallbacteria-1 TaxID=2013854 RepID=A0A2N1PQL6_9BACT|nr:MAG: hypothetical protein CVV64_09745 [Candidatus Wallbacteria bacterium HGW-Wallbacteria-1]
MKFMVLNTRFPDCGSIWLQNKCFIRMMAFLSFLTLTLFSGGDDSLAAVMRQPPLLVFLERGMNLYQDDVQQLNEDESLTAEWTLSGYFRLVSRCDEPQGSGNITRWDGISASYPVSSSDFGGIRFRILRKWKGLNSSEYSEVLAERDLSPGPGLTLREMGDGELDGIAESRDYAFTLDLGSMTIDFPMPLECSEPESFLYRIEVEMNYSSAQWDQSGNSVSNVPASQIVSRRSVIVADRTAPVLSLDGGLPPSGTTGDPLYPASFGLRVQDNNPNQELENVFIQIPSGSARSYTIYDGSGQLAARRFHEPSPQSGMEGRYLLESLPVSLPYKGPAGEVVRMADDGSPLEYDIVVKTLFGPGEVFRGKIENQDNDPPDITFFIGKSPERVEDGGVRISVAGGVYDPYDEDTFGEITLTRSDGTTLVRKYREPRSRVCQIDAGSLLGSDIPSIAEDVRLFFKAEAIDNVDGAVDVEVRGRHFQAGRTSGAIIMRDPGKMDFVISARDVAGNVLEVSFLMEVVDTRVSSATVGGSN